MVGDGDLISGPWFSLTSHALFLPSLELSVGFQHLLASLLLKSPSTQHPLGKVMGCLCHHFGQEDRHSCLGLPSGNLPRPSP